MDWAGFKASSIPFIRRFTVFGDSIVIFIARMLMRSILRPTIRLEFPNNFIKFVNPARGSWLSQPIGIGALRCVATSSGAEDKKLPARMAEIQRLMYQAEERYKAAGGGVHPIPKITLEHVTIGYARSGGPGGQNVNKVNTKVDMRFKVKNAHWLTEQVRERIMLMEKNRINKDGDIVISSTKTRTQKGNVEDALAKLQVLSNQKKKLQAIIDAASYVPPPPSEETVKRIAKLSAAGEQKRLDKKKSQSQKKAFRRSKDSWD